MPKRIVNIFLNPLFLALTITSIIILFVPKHYQKYKLELVEELSLPRDYLVHYLDLDNDGFKEKVIQKHYQSIPVIEIYNSNGSFNIYYSLEGQRACISKMIFGDMDQNGFMELFVFTEENDSAYVNCIEPLNKESNMVVKRAICKINMVDDRCDYFIDGGHVVDLNNDGHKEVAFFINSGYGLSPRNFYAIDFLNNSITKSPESYASIRPTVTILDLDNDGKKEICFKTGATANSNENHEVPYTDHSGWLMVLNNKLNFKFPPIEFPGDQKSVEAVPYKIGENYYLFLIVIDPHSNENLQKLYVYSTEGDLVTEIDVKRIGIGSVNSYFKLDVLDSGTENFLYIIGSKGDIYSIKDDFSIHLIRSFDDKLSKFYTHDFDGDGRMELLFYKFQSKEVCITDLNFNNVSSVAINSNFSNDVFHLGVMTSENNTPEIYGQFGQTLFRLSLIKIPFYDKLLIFIEIFAGVFFVILVSQKVQAINLKQRKKVEDRINELQLKSTLSQLDPHFAFNVINTISSSILNDNKERANDYLIAFSRLLRSSLEYSDKVSWPLEKEIEFVTAYLMLQLSRFGEIFEYKTVIYEGANLSIHIPKMIVQGYVENAIKHGLRPKGVGGLVEINIKQNSKSLRIEIKDNGIGRANSLKNRSFANTGKGMKLNAELVDLYNKMNNTTIRLSIEDLKDTDNHALGTRVKITIPFKSKLAT